VFGDTLIITLSWLIAMHNHVGNSVGVSMPQPKFRLEPSHNITIFGQPFFRCQFFEISYGLASFDFDIRQIGFHMSPHLL